MPSEDGYYASLFALTNGRIGLRMPWDQDNDLADPGLLHADLFAEGRSFEREIGLVVNPAWFAVELAGRPILPFDPSVRWFSQTLDMQHAHVERRMRISVGDLTVDVRLTLAVPAGAAGDLVVAEVDVTRVAGTRPVAVSLGTKWHIEPGTATRDKTRHGTVDQGFWTARHPAGTNGAIAIASRVDRAEGGSWHRRSEGAVTRVSFELPADSRRARLTSTTAVSVALTLGAAARAAQRDLAATGSVDEVLTRHRRIWRERWSLAPSIAGDDRALQGIRFGHFHLSQAPDRRLPAAGLAPRGLTSRRHGGLHHFNTEVSAVPYYASAEPDVARQLLAFRLEGLKAAEQYARATGFGGVRIPLHAGPDGAAVDSKDPALARIARTSLHGSADLLWAIALFHRLAGEWPFPADDLAAVVSGCADFLASAAHRISKKGFRVTGFDEFHPMVRGQFATTELLRWALAWAAAAGLPSAPARSRARWLSASRILKAPRANRHGVFPQFAGYFSLSDASNAAGRHASSQHCKQADVVAAMTMLPCRFSARELRANLKYYESRTLHASSLSFLPHAVAAAKVKNLGLAWRLTRQALRYNLDYAPREQYANGVHLGAAAGAWTTLLHGFLAFEATESHAVLRRNLPRDLRELTLVCHYRGHRLIARATPKRFEIDAPRGLQVRSDGAAGFTLHVHGRGAPS